MPEIFDESRRIVGSLTNPEDVDLVADRIVNGGVVVGVGNTGVYALAGDGGHPDFGDRLFTIKHRAPSRTMGMFLGAASFVEMVDFDRVEPHVRPLLENPETLENTLGDLAFVRVPLLRSVQLDLPAQMQKYAVSKRRTDGEHVPFIQSYFAVADTLFAGLAQKMADRKVAFPAISSMNYSGEGEITEREDADEFCADQKIDVLHDVGHSPLAFGSCPIYETAPTGLICVRTGNISRAVMERVLAPFGSFVGAQEPHVDTPPYRSLRLSDVPELINDNLYGSDARQAVVEQRLIFEREGATV
ncbi:MAG: hypothetical protein JWM37_715 [Candidatus Saccharibacteria bacterium]|nr:hypothetical protein [Candidatus Saccharibacteria bacterium]